MTLYIGGYENNWQETRVYYDEQLRNEISNRGDALNKPKGKWIFHFVD
jgi:hypothetical protein